MYRDMRFWKLVILLIFLSSSLGCDAFVRKFTREKKREEITEPVLNPEVKSGLFYDNDTKYRNYFAYWRGWQDELIQAISEPGMKRKQYCVSQALINLKKMSELLTGEKQAQLNSYIEQMGEIAEEINAGGVIDANTIRLRLSHIQLSVNKRLHYSKVRDWIKR